jgi:prophage regulatory protein
MRPTSHETRPTVPAPTPVPDSAVLLRIGAVTRLIGLGRSTIYRLMAESRFPAPVRLSTRAIAWRRSDLDRWSAERPTATH